jgi:hypothetical protein
MVSPILAAVITKKDKKIFERGIVEKPTKKIDPAFYSEKGWENDMSDDYYLNKPEAWKDEKEYLYVNQFDYVFACRG